MGSEIDRRLLIRNLAKRGGFKLDNPGQYFSEVATDDFKGAFPTYDLAKLRAAFPEVLEIDVATEEEDETGKVLEMVVVLKDGRADLEVPVGLTPPATTEALIDVVRAHLRKLLNMDNLRETSEVFDGFDD